jgi:hypothetical protein
MMEARLECKEPSSVNIEFEAEHWEVSKEHAAAETGKVPWHRDRHLAAGCRGKPKELTRGYCGSRRKLAAACRKVSHHARVAWCKRYIISNNWSRDKVEQGTLRVQTFRKRLWTRQEGRMGIKDLGCRQPLYLRKPMKWTWGNCGSLKQLVTAGMRMTHHARRKEHGLQK